MLEIQNGYQKEQLQVGQILTIINFIFRFKKRNTTSYFPQYINICSGLWPDAWCATLYKIWTILVSVFFVIHVYQHYRFKESDSVVSQPGVNSLTWLPHSRASLDLFSFRNNTCFSDKRNTCQLPFSSGFSELAERWSDVLLCC